MNTADAAIIFVPAAKHASKAFVKMRHLQLHLGQLAMDVLFMTIAIQTIVVHAIMHAIQAIIVKMANVQMLAKMF